MLKIRPIGRKDLYQVDWVLISLSKRIPILYLTTVSINLVYPYKPNGVPCNSFLISTEARLQLKKDPESDRLPANSL
jgi:hypothetical protein